MAFVRDHYLAIDVVTDTVLLHAWVEFDFHCISRVFLERHFFDWAAERWVNLEADSRLKRASVFDGEVLRDRHRWNTLLPEVLEVNLRVVELKGRRDEVAKNITEVNWLGLSLISDEDLALPLFKELADCRCIRADFNHDAHLGVQHDLCRSDREHLRLFGLLLFGQSRCFGVILSILRFVRLLLFFFALTSPDDLHRLSATVFEEELLYDVLVGVFRTKVDLLDIFLVFSDALGLFELFTIQG